jgi:toxin ParE1/3/4
VARASGSTETADRVVERIVESFFALGQYPHMGRRRDHDLRAGLRSFPVGAYVVVYRIDGADADILHVMRGSRDIGSLLGE